jgi:hypothetical protein
MPTSAQSVAARAFGALLLDDEAPLLPRAQDPKHLPRAVLITKPGSRIVLDRDYIAATTALVIAAPNVTIDGRGHVIEFNTDGKAAMPGIVVYTGAWAEDDKILPPIKGRQADNVTIRNLVLRQVKKAPRSHGVRSFHANNLKIENCTIMAGGEDAQAIFLRYGDVELRRNVLLSEQDGASNRHSGPANVTSPKVVAIGNVLVGGNSGFNVHEAGSRLIGNVISHLSIATNGYGVWCYQPTSVEIRDNVMLPLDGRGVLLNGTNEEHPANDNQIVGNVMLCWNRPNVEYGDSLNATGVRIRYAAHRNVVSSNTILAVGGGLYAGASGIYLTSQTPGATSTIVDNSVYALLLGEPSRTQFAKAITFEGHEQCDYAIDKNQLCSNHHIISLSGYDTSGEQRRPMVGNYLQWVDGQNALAAFQEAVSAKCDEIHVADNPWSQWVVARALTALRPLAEVPLQSTRKTFFSGYWKGNEFVSLRASKGNAGVGLEDIEISASQYPGKRRIEIGEDAVEYWLGRDGDEGNAPYRKHLTANVPAKELSAEYEHAPSVEIVGKNK